MTKKCLKILLTGMICSFLLSINVFAEDETIENILDNIEENTLQDTEEIVLESVQESIEESLSMNMYESTEETVLESIQDTIELLDDEFGIEDTEIYINPLYDNELTEFDLINGVSSYNVGLFSSRSLSNEYFQSWSEVVDTVRYAMKSRSETVIIDYESSETLATGWLRQLLSEVMEETSSAVEGDYLECHFGGCKGSRKTSRSNDKYYHHLVLTFTYYTTDEQEAMVTEHIKRLLNSFDFTSATSDYEKIKTIYDWLCTNISYDYTNLNDDNYKLKYSAYAALVNRTSVCQGYASLAYRLLKESGIEVRVVTGTSSGENHAWLIADIDGLFYNLDPTWDSRNTTYKYFLKGQNDFLNHTRAKEFTTDIFEQKYPMADSNYKYTEMTEDNNAEKLNGWVKNSQGEWRYYIDSRMLKSLWIQEGNKWYYLKEDGIMATGWYQLSGKWYYFNASGSMRTGWLNSNNRWYYLKENGIMATGWYQLSGKWYYFNSSGSMRTGWLNSNNRWYYLKEDGIMATGWYQLSGKWYYFNSSGSMRIGWLNYNDKWYYFDGSGVMKTGWLNEDSKWYYLRENGVMVVGEYKIGNKIYQFNGNGILIS